MRTSSHSGRRRDLQPELRLTLLGEFGLSRGEVREDQHNTWVSKRVFQELFAPLLHIDLLKSTRSPSVLLRKVTGVKLMFVYGSLLPSL